MNGYNGFSGKQRLAALKWFRNQQAKGMKPHNPSECDICTQTNGALEWHSENYSSPFGKHIGQFGLCYICHMMIHCRYKNQTAWKIYKQAIKDKKMFKNYKGRHWMFFKRECLDNNFNMVSYDTVEKNNYKMLLDIETGIYIPKKIVEETTIEQIDMFSD